MRTDRAILLNIVCSSCIDKRVKMRKVKIESKRYVLNDFFKVEEAQLRFEQFNGKMSGLVRRLSLERGNSVAVLVFNSDTQKLLLINQFRYPTYQNGPGWMIETIAGIIDPGETPEEAARREAHEETGLNVTALEFISVFYPSPGGCSEKIFLYFAEVSGKNSRHKLIGGIAREDENILSMEFSLNEAVEKIRSGEIQDGKTIIGIFWLENRTLKQKT